MVFGVIVGQVGMAGTPVDEELALFGPIFYPVEAHINGLRALLFDSSIIGKTDGGQVVNLNGSGGLRMVHFGKRGAYWHHFLGVDVGCADSGFGR
jgi:hypothetical protein